MRTFFLLIIMFFLNTDQCIDTQEQESYLCNTISIMEEHNLTTTQFQPDNKQHHDTISNDTKDSAHSLKNPVSHFILTTYAKLCSEKKEECLIGQSCSCCGFVSHPIAAIKIAPNKEHTKLLVRVWAQKSELKNFIPINDVEARQLHTFLLQRFQEERKKHLFKQKAYQLDEYTSCYNYDLYDKDRGILTCETILPEHCAKDTVQKEKTNDAFTKVIMRKYKEEELKCEHVDAKKENNVSEHKISFKHKEYQGDHFIETVCDDTAHNLNHPSSSHFLNLYFKARKSSSEDATKVDDATKCYRWVLCKTYLTDEQFQQYMHNKSTNNKQDYNKEPAG